MSCGDRRYYVRAGDAWPVTLTWTFDQQPLNLTGLSAKLSVRRAESGTELLAAASPDDRISIAATEGRVSLLFSGTDTQAWLLGGRGEIVLAVAIFDADNEPGTRRTAVVDGITVLPGMVP